MVRQRLAEQANSPLLDLGRGLLGVRLHGSSLSTAGASDNPGAVHAFESDRSFDDFDFSFNPELPKAKVLDLATCRFLDSHTNVLLVGPAGVGKSHLAQAIGHRACMAGFSTLYLPAHRMLTTLRAARADGSYDRVLARYTSPQLLIVDDLGLRALGHDGPWTSTR